MLVLCWGNVCRSPLAAAVLARVLGADRVRSRALKDYGKRRTHPPAAKKVREHAATLALCLDGHRALTVRDEDYRWADRVLYMEPAHLDKIPAPVHSRCECLAAYVGRDKIPDPGFMSRGPVLTKVLTWVVLAAEKCGRGLAQEEAPAG